MKPKVKLFNTYPPILIIAKVVQALKKAELNQAVNRFRDEAYSTNDLMGIVSKYVEVI